MLTYLNEIGAPHSAPGGAFNTESRLQQSLLSAAEEDSVQVFPLSPEDLLSLQLATGLTPDDAAVAGLDWHYHNPTHETLQRFIQANPVALKKGGDPFPLVWQNQIAVHQRPEIPFGRSVRGRCYNPLHKSIGPTYLRILVRRDGSRYDFQQYLGPAAKPQASFVSDNISDVMTPWKPFIIVDNYMHALQARKIRSYDEPGVATVSLNGILKYGYSTQGFLFPPHQRGTGRRTFTSRDAKALIELLHLPHIPLLYREVIMLCERHWLQCEELEHSIALLQQMKALRDYLHSQGAKPIIVTPPERNGKGQSPHLGDILALEGEFLGHDFAFGGDAWTEFHFAE